MLMCVCVSSFYRLSHAMSKSPFVVFASLSRLHLACISIIFTELPAFSDDSMHLLLCRKIPRTKIDHHFNWTTTTRIMEKKETWVKQRKGIQTFDWAAFMIRTQRFHIYAVLYRLASITYLPGCVLCGLWPIPMYCGYVEQTFFCCPVIYGDPPNSYAMH